MSQSRRRRAFGSLLFLLTIATLAAVSRAFTVAAGAQAVENRIDVLIGFAGTPGPPEEALVRAVGGLVKHRYHLVPAIAANVPPQAVAALRANPRVTVVESDVRVFAVDLELDDSWGAKRIGAGTVHQQGIWGVGVGVAILDTGIDYTHPDLALNYAGGYDFVNDDGDPFDDNAHGTHVAGIVAARDDDAGVVGVAPHATLYALKVLDASGNGSFSNVIAAMQWAVDHGAAGHQQQLRQLSGSRCHRAAGVRERRGRGAAARGRVGQQRHLPGHRRHRAVPGALCLGDRRGGDRRPGPQPVLFEHRPGRRVVGARRRGELHDARGRLSGVQRHVDGIAARGWGGGARPRPGFDRRRQRQPTRQRRGSSASDWHGPGTWRRGTRPLVSDTGWSMRCPPPARARRAIRPSR